MVGSRAFACVLHRGPRSAVFARARRDERADSLRAAAAGALLASATQLRPAGETAIRELDERPVLQVAASSADVLAASADVAAAVDAPLAAEASVELAAAPVAVLLGPGSGGEHGEASGDAGSEDGEAHVYEEPRRLRSMRVAAARAPKPRVAQRLGRGSSRGPAPLRAATLKARAPKPRRVVTQLPAQLKNLARRDLEAAGFTGILPNPDALEGVEGVESREPEQVSAPPAVARDSRDADCAQLLAACARAPWISTLLPALRHTPACVEEPVLSASLRPSAAVVPSIPDVIEDPLLAAFFDLPGFAHLKDAMDAPRGGKALISSGSSAVQLGASEPDEAAEAASRQQPLADAEPVVELEPVAELESVAELEPVAELELLQGVDVAEIADALVHESDEVPAQPAPSRGLLDLEACDACQRMFRNDWLACPHCGELSSAATLPVIRAAAATPAPARTKPEQSTRRAAAPRAPARVVRPTPRVQAAPRAERSAFWVYAIGGALILVLVLFLVGVL